VCYRMDMVQHNPMQLHQNSINIAAATSDIVYVAMFLWKLIILYI
jgi:hypothetical protein